MDVRTPGLLTGHSAPYLYKDSDEVWKLMVGSESGTIFYYQPTEDWSGSFTLLTNSFSNIDDGEYTDAVFQDINNDNIPELLTGNYRGGITLYGDESTVDAIEDLSSEQILIYPNPTKNILFIAATNNITAITLISVSGTIIQKQNMNSSRVELNLENVTSGIYLLYIQLNNGNRQVHKIFKL
ncbi:MAG: T9SS type A sorting domain-containing protein [Bacteroidetes bacterium]|nr:T9SS type A sorting domain-containing protein [Bacteroidota bacterium]